MWRSEAEVALNDLEEFVREAADLYADDAEVLAPGELADLFADLAARRDRFASRLADHIRRSGDLPVLPDADRETFHRLGNRLRAALAADGRQALLEDRIAAEEELHQRIEQALAQPVGPEAESLLAEFRRDNQAARELLRARLESP